jgi:hypothetical protein
MIYLKADANTEVLVGPAVAVGDGFTPVTNLHGGSSNLAAVDEAELIKYGGSTPLTVTDISTNAMTPITGADGYYTLDLSTGNTDTEGFLVLVINDDSLILPIRHEFMVVNANVYDSLFAAATTDYLQTDTVQWLATAVTTSATTNKPQVDVDSIDDDATAANNAEAFFDGTGYAGTGNTIPTVTTVSNEVSADVTKISGTAAAADKLELSAQTVINGACTGTPTISTSNTDLTGYTNDQLIGRTVIFTSGNAEGEATNITDYANTSGVLTYSDLAQAPAAADTFVIL